MFNGRIMAEEQIEKKNGRVLGIEEESASIREGVDDVPSTVFYGLPESKLKSLQPKKKQNVNPPGIDDNVIGAVLDARSGAVLFSKEAEKEVSIASISKLATALVFLDQEKDWEEVYEIGDRDRVNGGRVYLYRGDKVKVRDLFYLSLVSSANTATQAMVNSLGLGNDEFVAKMNQKMRDLGLYKTSFEDVVGIGAKNKSNAIEVAKLAKEALKNPKIREATMLFEYSFETEQGKKIRVESTDTLIGTMEGDDIKIMGGKTGYTDSAGYCFAGKYIDKNGNELISVALRGDNINSRFENSKKLAIWAFESYNW